MPQFNILIGGTYDGRRVWATNRHILVPIRRPIPPTADETVHTPLENDAYELEMLRGQHKTFTVYRFSELSVDDMIERILDRYPDEEKEK